MPFCLFAKSFVGIDTTASSACIQSTASIGLQVLESVPWSQFLDHIQLFCWLILLKITYPQYCEMIRATAQLYNLYKVTNPNPETVICMFETNLADFFWTDSPSTFLHYPPKVCWVFWVNEPTCRWEMNRCDKVLLVSDDLCQYFVSAQLSSTITCWLGCIAHDPASYPNGWWYFPSVLLGWAQPSRRAQNR